MESRQQSGTLGEVGNSTECRATPRRNAPEPSTTMVRNLAEGGFDHGKFGTSSTKAVLITSSSAKRHSAPNAASKLLIWR